MPASADSPPAETGNVIEIHGLSKRFGHHEVLHQITFNVARGQVLGMIGPNGAGKSTTMRILLDIVRPSSGKVRVLGDDPRSTGPELRRRIGYLPGELMLDARRTGNALLRHYAEISGPVRPGRIEELAERFDVDLNRPVGKLSKGNKQKIGIIQAFMHSPELLILDEPTSGLDPLMQQEFLKLVREARTADQSVLLSSHVISEIQQAADSVVILRRGEVASIAAMTELRNSAARRLKLSAEDTTEDVQRLLGSVPGVSQLNTDPDGAGLRVSAHFRGSVPILLEALRHLRITDLVLEEPDLEEAVLSLYSSCREPASASAPTVPSTEGV